MGGGSKKAHQSFAVSPTAAPAAGGSTAAGEGATAAAAVHQVVEDIAALPLGDGDPIAEYGGLAEAYAVGAGVVTTAAQEGLPSSDLAELEGGLQQAAAAHLEKAPVPWLQTVAATLGFQQPTLLGEVPSQPHPLAEWLHPDTSPVAKDALQAKALETHAAIAAGSPAPETALDEVDTDEEPVAEPATGAVDAGPKQSVTTAGAAVPPAPASGPPSTAPGAPRSFMAKQKDIHEALAHYAASSAPLPAQRDSGEIEALPLEQATAEVVGGMHAKRFYADPQGTRWMFKPDQGAGGAAAHAEACASRVASVGGMPAVPVYVRTVGGQVGALQQLVPNARPLAGAMSALSQPDVDAVVRSHVSAWLIGDHDAKPDNVLRTEGGGLVPVDHGQAFKFYGTDRLDLDYNPNHAANGDRTLYQKLYRAHLQGTLAPGVRVRPEAALGVIKRYEAIPDHEFRELLAPAAREGVKHRVSWFGPMAKNAKGKLGRAPSDAEVESEFLSHAVARKNSLRASFVAFFAEVFSGSSGAGQKSTEAA